MKLFDFRKKTAKIINMKRRIERASTGYDMYGGGSNTLMEWYSPEYDRLDRPLLAEKWVPEDVRYLHKIFRSMYKRGSIEGAAIDILSSLPWSDFDVHAPDETVQLFYNEALHQIFDRLFLELIHREMLIIGRFASSLVFDEKKGYWTSVIPHNPDYLDVIPVPVYGEDPILNYTPPPSETELFLSNDPRLNHIREKMGDLYDSYFKKEMIPLIPYNTIWLARRTTPYDYFGTSILARLIPVYALERALQDGTLASAKRRLGSVLHVVAGDDNRWEPTPEEMEAIADSFIRADEDPVSAVVVTRTGVSASEIRTGGQIWKISDEWSYITEVKLRALGINEALLSGDATYTSYDQARTILMDNVRMAREYISSMTILKKAEMLARINNFVKVSQAELDHNVRVDKQKMKTNISWEEALRIPKSDLILPEIKWFKSLEPIDQTKIEILRSLEDKGIPVPLEEYARAGGYSIDNFLQKIESDIDIKNRSIFWKSLTKAYDDANIEEWKEIQQSMVEYDEGEGINNRRFGGRSPGEGFMKEEFPEEEFEEGPLEEFSPGEEEESLPPETEESSSLRKYYNWKKGKEHGTFSPSELEEIWKSFSYNQKIKEYSNFRLLLSSSTPSSRLKKMIIETLNKELSFLRRYGTNRSV